MLGMSLAESSGLNAKDIKPCPFTIATSLRDTKHSMGLTKVPLRYFVFKFTNLDGYNGKPIRIYLEDNNLIDVLTSSISRKERGSNCGVKLT